MKAARVGFGVLVVASLWTAPAVGSAVQAGAAEHRSTLRVGLWTLWRDKELTVSRAAEGAATILICGKNGACRSAPLGAATTIRVDAGHLDVSARRNVGSVAVSGIFTVSAHGETLTLAHPLRVTARNGELVLAVTLPVETYVERVVASESSEADGPESLKALAIVVRSFALHQPHGHTDYDLCDSTHCQLLRWVGDKSRGAAAHAATLATAGQTLWFHGQRAAAWFHQNCGGRTATAVEAWGMKGQNRPQMPWIVSNSDRFCTKNEAKEWSNHATLAELTTALAAAGLVRPGWTSLTVARRGESGRAVTIEAGSTTMAAEDFRLAVGRALGWGRIPSTWFEIARSGDGFVFHGRGSGHGVGLCQAGAAEMAVEGRSAAEILAQYFPGASAADEATGQSWQAVHGEGVTLETLSAGDARRLDELNRALARAESRSGLHPAGPLTVRAFASMPAFRDATLAPGWVAAFTEGAWIGTQPLETLASKRLLADVMRHEFLHALVEGVAAPGTPLWLREGLVEAWAGSDADAPPAGPAPSIRLDALNRMLAHPASEAESRSAHLAAGWFAARFVEHYGREKVTHMLQFGAPADAFSMP